MQNDSQINADLVKVQFNNFTKTKKHLKITLFICVFFLFSYIAIPSTFLLFLFLFSLGDLRRRNLNYRFEKSMLLQFEDEIIFVNDTEKLESLYHFW